MMRSLFSGVAGLKTHQVKMDVIGNNIANVNTTSFKSQSITFSDLMYQTTQRASRATETTGGVNARQIGLGAKSGAIGTAIETQGATETTNNPFDMRITGDAFYIVNNGNQTLYTRDGSFYVDGAGNLAMQSTGYFVYGWTAVEDEETGEIKVNTNGGVGKLQIMSPENQTYPPEGTTEAVVSGNIDARDTNITSDNGKTVSLEFYDNLGYLYTAKFAIRDVDDVEHTYTMTLEDILDASGNTIGAQKLQYVTFTQKDNEETINDIRDNWTKTTEIQKYTATVGSKKTSFKTAAGSTAYSGISTSGFISDLPAGFLDEVYTNEGIVPAGVEDYSSATPPLPDDYYMINSDGSITISKLVVEAESTDAGNGNERDLGDYFIYSAQDTGSQVLISFAGQDGQKLETISVTSTGKKASGITPTAIEQLINYYGITDPAASYLRARGDDTTVTISSNGTTVGASISVTYPDTTTGRDKTETFRPAYKKALDISGANTKNQIIIKSTESADVAVPTSGLISDLTGSQKNLLSEIFEDAVLGGTAVSYEFDFSSGEPVLRTKAMSQNNADIQGPFAIGTNYKETSITAEIQEPMGLSTVTFLNAAEGGTILYEDIPRTGYVRDLADATLTEDFFTDVYNYTVDKGADNYENLTYRILDDGKLQVVNNSVTLTYDSKTGDIVTPTEKLVLDFDQNALIDDQLKMAGFTDVNLDFSTTTNYNTSATSTIGAVKGDLQSLRTGRAVGEMNGITVSKDGTIYATYSNGQTKLLGQIATAEFANASGLEKQGDNLYNSTLNSGEATVQDVTTDGGYITTGVLEMSNVDLSSEFTNMITTQRGFQANSRIITVSDTLLEELTNLKR